LKPLIENGKLKKTLPALVNSPKQRYVAADAGIPIPTEEGILEYCNTPRRKSEMQEYFGLNLIQLNKHLAPLFADKRLIGTDPREDNKNGRQGYVNASANAQTKDELILVFCRTPKYLHEIGEHFGVSRKCDGIKQFIAPLIESGRLKSVYALETCGTHLQYYTADTEVAVLTDENLLAYCDTPRGRREVAEHFGVNLWVAKRHLDSLVKSGGLRYTIPDEPASKNQRFAAADSAFNILTDEAVCAFCETPKTKAEVAEHFGLTKSFVHIRLGKLIKEGKITYTRPETPSCRWQSFVTVK
jgi:predicted ArsR family transcriptional regulator